MAGAENRKHLAMKQPFTLQSLLIHLNKARSDGFGALNAAFNVQSSRNYCAVWPSSRPLIVKCYREFSHSGMREPLVLVTDFRNLLCAWASVKCLIVPGVCSGHLCALLKYVNGHNVSK